MKKMLKVNMLRLLLGMSTLVFFGISGSFTAYAGDTPAAPQQHKRVVKGRVTDKKTGEPIVGATVWFKESTSGTATDAAGNYSLNRPQGNAILSSSGNREEPCTILLDVVADEDHRTGASGD